MAKAISNKSRKVLWSDGQIPRRVARAEKRALAIKAKQRNLEIRRSNA